MFRTITSRLSRDHDYPDRAFTIDVYSRIIEGALYDHLPHGFHHEKNRDTGDYIPLRDRRPCVRYNICRLVVDDSVSLLFSEGHFPTPECDDIAVKEALKNLCKEQRLNEMLLTAATIGSVGSVAIHFCALKQKDGSHRVFIRPYRTTYFTPVFDPQAPDTLLRLREQYKVQGDVLIAMGYDLDEPKAQYWFCRIWDDQVEHWYIPWRVKPKSNDEDEEESRPIEDKQRTVKHGLGFVPWIWVRNLPGQLRLLETDLMPDIPVSRNGLTPNIKYSDCDGACTFSGAIDAMIEIDYQLSQAGRGLKYSMDPMLMLKQPPAPDGEFIKSVTNAIILDKDGDAKLLEIQGTAFQVVMEYVRGLREMALETIHGNRANADKVSAAQSGRAMELMNQALIWLADRLRVSYGEGALQSILKMAIATHQKYPLTVSGQKWPSIDPNTQITLRWPRWFAPSARDRQETAETLKRHKEAGHMSRETAVKSLAADFDIEDVGQELDRIHADELANLELVAKETQATAKVTTTV